MRIFNAVTFAAVLLICGLTAFCLLPCREIDSSYADLRLKLQQNALLTAYLHMVWQSVLPDARSVSARLDAVCSRCPGAVVIGLLDRHRQNIYAYGRDCRGKQADENTVFETASVSKVFAGLVLARLAAQGKLSLEMSVAHILHERHHECSLHRSLTLRQLATHSSGLPPWPDNRGDTTCAYNSAQLYRYLRCAVPEAPPDTVALYSNTAFALLGQILSEYEGQSFDQLLQNLICRPLHMESTAVGLPEYLRDRLTIGHRAGGEAALSSSPTAGGAADGVRSTVSDLLKLVRAYIEEQPADWAEPLRQSRQPYVSFDEKLDSALGWFVDTADGTIQKSGRIAGYRSHVCFDPTTRCGVVIMAGWEEFPSPQLGKLFLNDMVTRRQLAEKRAARLKSTIEALSNAGRNGKI